MQSCQSASLPSMAPVASVCHVLCLVAKIMKEVLIDYQWSSGACGLDVDDDDSAYMYSDWSVLHIDCTYLF